MHSCRGSRQVFLEWVRWKVEQEKEWNGRYGVDERTRKMLLEVLEELLEQMEVGKQAGRVVKSRLSRCYYSISRTRLISL